MAGFNTWLEISLRPQNQSSTNVSAQGSGRSQDSCTHRIAFVVLAFEPWGLNVMHN